MSDLQAWKARLDKLLIDLKETAESHLRVFEKFISTPWEDLLKETWGGVKRGPTPHDQSFYVRVLPALSQEGWDYTDRYSNGTPDLRSMVCKPEGLYSPSEVRLVTIESFEVDYEVAKSDAYFWWKKAREQYIVKNASKLSEITEGCREPQIEQRVSLTRSGLVEGTLLLAFPNGDKIRAVTTIKWNRSKLGKFFVQYPTLFWHTPACGEEQRQSQEWLTGNFAKKVAPERALPEKVEDLKTLSTLAVTLQGREELEKKVQARQARGYVAGARGPQAQITRCCNKLSLPQDLTPEEAMQLLVKNLGWDRKECLRNLSRSVVIDSYRGEVMGIEEPPLGKRGKALRDLYKSLESLELVRRGGSIRVTEWGKKVVGVLSQGGE